MPVCYMQSGGGGGGGGDKFIRNVALNLVLLGAYFVFESFGDGGGFFGGGGGGDSGNLSSCKEMTPVPGLQACANFPSSWSDGFLETSSCLYQASTRDTWGSVFV